MTFQWPLGLLALAVMPVALALLALTRRRQARYAVRFSNLDLLAQVARETRSPWRLVPTALLLAALCALAVGLARPAISVAKARHQGTVILALDRSGSMLADDVSPDRITASDEAAKRFIEGLPDGISVGVVSFSDTADVVSAPTSDRTAAARAIDTIQAGGATAIGDAINRSLDLLGASSTTTAGTRGRAILLLSDGANTRGTAPATAAAAARKAGIPIYTIALGTPDGVLDGLRLNMGFGTIAVPPDPVALKAVSDATGGEAFTALDQQTLKRVYDHIGTRVGATHVRRELTFAVGGVAAVLLLAAAAASARLRRIA